jgi:hypothetical protein
LDVVKVMMAYVVAIVVVVGNEKEGKKYEMDERKREAKREAGKSSL